MVDIHAFLLAHQFVKVASIMPSSKPIPLPLGIAPVIAGSKNRAVPV